MSPLALTSPVNDASTPDKSVIVIVSIVPLLILSPLI